MSDETPKALTPGEIARRIGQPIHRVQYVIVSRQLEPIARAGNLRIFSEADVQYIAGQIRRMDAEGMESEACHA
jgi:hypothetical protein